MSINKIFNYFSHFPYIFSWWVRLGFSWIASISQLKLFQLNFPFFYTLRLMLKILLHLHVLSVRDAFAFVRVQTQTHEHIGSPLVVLLLRVHIEIIMKREMIFFCLLVHEKVFFLLFRIIRVWILCNDWDKKEGRNNSNAKEGMNAKCQIWWKSFSFLISFYHFKTSIVIKKKFLLKKHDKVI